MMTLCRSLGDRHSDVLYRSEHVRVSFLFVDSRRPSDGGRFEDELLETNALFESLSEGDFRVELCVETVVLRPDALLLLASIG